MSQAGEPTDRPSDEGQYILRTEGLTKQFGGLTAIDDVDYRMPYGEVNCLIGPNGAGKSTFFNMLAGQLSPTAGRIVYKDEEITELEPHQRARRGLSIKFQDVNVYPELSVRENLRIPVQRYERDEDIATVIDELLALIDLEEQAGFDVDRLSHGQQQWLEIAIATAINPDLLLLDEPTAGMTIEETEATGELIQSLADRGMSVIVVEHDITFVEQIAERVTVLHHGAIFAEGTVDEIKNDEEVQKIYLGEE
jgi:branched-chain amino acid transport system ATP-binding protein